MKRGTIGLLGDHEPTLLPTFRRACQVQPVALRLLFAALRAKGFRVDERFDAAPLELYNGDFLEGGRGEILIPAA